MNINSFKPRTLAFRATVLIEKMRGLDFSAVLRPEDVGLDPTKASQSSSSGNRHLTNVLKRLDVKTTDSIIDIGCGKGGALKSMLRFPFERIDGIELSERIAGIAENNFKKLGVKKINIYTGDATRFEKLAAYNMIYLYNPFPDQVMEGFARALEESLKQREREILIIYKNPVCNDLIVGRGIFSKMASFADNFSTGISVYSNYGMDRSRLQGKPGFRSEPR